MSEEFQPKNFDELAARFPELRNPRSVWEDKHANFHRFNHYAWRTRPAFFSVFWKSEWR